MGGSNMSMERTLVRTRRWTLVSFLLTALFAASLFVVIDSRAANAESLLGRTKCVLLGLFRQDCSSSTPAPTLLPQQTPAAPSQGGSSSGGASAGSTQPAPAASSSSEPALPPGPLLEPLAFNDSLRQPLPARVTHSTTPTGTGKGTLQANVFSIAGGQQNASVLGATTEAAPIEATEQGWRIAGIAWYWWAAAGAGLALLIIAIRRLMLRRNLKIVAET